MVMMQITQQKKEKLADYTEKILHLAGKMMQCVEELEDTEGEMGQRTSYRHMGMRDKEDMYDPYEDDEEYGSRMGMRSRRGSYSRYR